MNATRANHPTEATLHAYGLGKLETLLAETVDKHLDMCLDCRRRAAELSSDSDAGWARNVGGRQGSVTPDFSVSTGLAVDAADTLPRGTESTDALPPSLISHPDYEVLRELGRGGIGVVYLARNTLMGRQEVLKVISSQHIHRPGVRERFLAEICGAARLHHPNIVTAFSALQFGDDLVLAMEYLEGLDLSRMVEAKGPLPVIHACAFIAQAAMGLQHAHDQGMVHRDIKPANLMVVRTGNRPVVKILDFGLAKLRREGSAEGALTAAGQWLGTPEYIAPEQIQDPRQADIRADIYSLGCTFYYLLTGRPPFQAGSLYEIYQAHHSMDAPLLNLVRPEVPVDLAVLVATMMAKDPDRRFQTPREVAQALKPFIKKETSAATKFSSDDEPPAGPRSGGPDRVPVQPARVVSLASALTSTSRQPTGSTPAVPAWNTLVETDPQADLSEEVRALRERRGLPAWFWPLTAAALMIVGVAVGWRLSASSNANQSGSNPHPTLAASPQKAVPPAPVPAKAIEAPRGRVEVASAAGISQPPSPPTMPPSREVERIASTARSESRERVEVRRQDDAATAASEEPVAPKPAPTPPAAAPKEKTHAELTQEELLERRGLKRVKKYYVVATELEVMEGWRRVLPVWNTTQEAWAALNQAWEAEFAFQQLDNMRIGLNTYINELNVQMGTANRVLRDQLQAEAQQARLNLTEVQGRMAVVAKSRVSDARRAQLRDEFMRRRQEFFVESNKLLPTFVKVLSEYEELERDGAVVNAIRSLKEEKKAPISLGPSEFCKKAYAEIKESQKMLSYDPDSFGRRRRPKLKQDPRLKAKSLTTNSGKTENPK